MPNEFTPRVEHVPVQHVERIAALCAELSSEPLLSGVVVLLTTAGQPGIFGFAYRPDGKVLDTPPELSFRTLEALVDEERRDPSVFPPLSDPDGGRRAD